MSDKALTPKQDKFWKKYLELGNASAAYRFCYNCKGMKPASITRNAHTLLKNTKIAAMLEKAKQKQLEKHEVTLGSLTRELEEHRLLAVKIEAPAAANGSTMAKARLHGKLTETVEVKIERDHNTISDMDACRAIAFLFNQTALAMKEKEEKK